jgi:tRNA pseudouridine55 synthase
MTSVEAPINGMLAIKKPAGMISKDVSRLLQRVCNRRLKLGHVGTLDPAASGVLPVLLGSATRIQDFLLELPKTYLFSVRFGIATDSMDWTGNQIGEGHANVTQSEVVAALPSFVGEICQTPPVYSAVKYKGKPLYKYAREGKDDVVPLADLSRKVTVYSFELVKQLDDGDWQFRVNCSKGTYVRVLATDLAKVLGTVGMITSLHRESAAGVAVEHAVDLDLINDINDLKSYLVPLERIHLGIPNWRSLAPGWTSRLRSGQKLLVQADHFNKTLEGEFRPSSLLCLLDEQGLAFGLGVASPAQDGCIQICMKRGL